MTDPTHTASRALARVRQLLLLARLAGAAGTGAELLLIGHYEGWQQLVPLALLGAALPIGAWHGLSPGGASLRVLQGLMLLFFLSGALGVVLHYQGNAAFELEMYPSMAGMELVAKTMSGATPVLAPGTMVLLGLIGLALTWGRAHTGGRTSTVED